jgi:hypothetical protein
VPAAVAPAFGVVPAHAAGGAVRAALPLMVALGPLIALQ